VIYLILTYIILPLLCLFGVMWCIKIMGKYTNKYRVICVTHDKDSIVDTLEEAYNFIPEDQSCRHIIRNMKVLER